MTGEIITMIGVGLAGCVKTMDLRSGLAWGGPGTMPQTPSFPLSRE